MDVIYIIHIIDYYKKNFTIVPTVIILENKFDFLMAQYSKWNKKIKTEDREKLCYHIILLYIS